jgi:hypothetical protein
MKNKTIKLSTLERLSLPTILPDKDNIDRLLIRKSIVEKTEIGIEESNKIELKQEGSVLRWNAEGKFEKDYDFSETEINYMKNCIDDLSNKKELRASLIDLYQKIKG